MRLLRKILVMAILLLIPFSAGISFGSYPVDQQKETDSLDVGFDVAVFNAGNQSFEVRLEADNTDSYNVSLAGSKELKGGIADNPSGEGWYHLGGGRYAPTETLNFSVSISQFRDTNSIRIPVTVEARKGSETGETRSDVVYSREIIYTAEVVGLRPDEKEDEGGKIWGSDEEEHDEGKTGEKSPSVSQEENGTGYQPGADNGTVLQEEKQERGSNTLMTALLTGGIVVVIYYIYSI